MWNSASNLSDHVPHVPHYRSPHGLYSHKFSHSEQINWDRVTFVREPARLLFGSAIDDSAAFSNKDEAWLEWGNSVWLIARHQRTKAKFVRRVKRRRDSPFQTKPVKTLPKAQDEIGYVSNFCIKVGFDQLCYLLFYSFMLTVLPIITPCLHSSAYYSNSWKMTKIIILNCIES